MLFTPYNDPPILETMSLNRGIPTLRQAARALARPASLKAVPHPRAAAAAFPSLSNRSTLSTTPSRAFSATPISSRYSPIAEDPKWKKGEVVTYDELKPITQSPDNVSRVVSALSQVSAYSWTGPLSLVPNRRFS